MFILDYESTAIITDLTGTDIVCEVKGLVIPDQPGVAGLGHSPTELSMQNWKELNISVSIELEFKEGKLTFPDNSYQKVNLTQTETLNGKYYYKLVLSDEQKI